MSGRRAYPESTNVRRSRQPEIDSGSVCGEASPKCGRIPSHGSVATVAGDTATPNGERRQEVHRPT